MFGIELAQLARDMLSSCVQQPGRTPFVHLAVQGVVSDILSYFDVESAIERAQRSDTQGTGAFVDGSVIFPLLGSTRKQLDCKSMYAGVCTTPSEKDVKLSAANRGVKPAECLVGPTLAIACTIDIVARRSLDAPHDPLETLYEDLKSASARVQTMSGKWRPWSEEAPHMFNTQRISPEPTPLHSPSTHSESEPSSTSLKPIKTAHYQSMNYALGRGIATGDIVRLKSNNRKFQDDVASSGRSPISSRLVVQRQFEASAIDRSTVVVEAFRRLQGSKFEPKFAAMLAVRAIVHLVYLLPTELIPDAEFDALVDNDVRYQYTTMLHNESEQSNARLNVRIKELTDPDVDQDALAVSIGSFTDQDLFDEMKTRILTAMERETTGKNDEVERKYQEMICWGRHSTDFVYTQSTTRVSLKLLTDRIDAFLASTKSKLSHVLRPLVDFSDAHVNAYKLVRNNPTASTNTLLAFKILEAPIKNPGAPLDELCVSIKLVDVGNTSDDVKPLLASTFGVGSETHTIKERGKQSLASTLGLVLEYNHLHVTKFLKSETNLLKVVQILQQKKVLEHGDPPYVSAPQWIRERFETQARKMMGWSSKRKRDENIDMPSKCNHAECLLVPLRSRPDVVLRLVGAR